MTSSEMAASPLLCCNRVGQGDPVSTQVLFSEAWRLGRRVELLGLGNLVLGNVFLTELKAQVDFPLLLSPRGSKQLMGSSETNNDEIKIQKLGLLEFLCLKYNGLLAM